MLSSIQVLNHKRSFQSMPRSLCFFVRLEIRGGAALAFYGAALRPPARGRLAGGAGV